MLDDIAAIGGKQAGRWTCAGILTGNLVHISCCLLGIGWVIAHSTAAYTVLKLAGGAYLIILGIQSLAARSAKPRITGVALIGLGVHLWLSDNTRPA